MNIYNYWLDEFPKQLAQRLPLQRLRLLYMFPNILTTDEQLSGAVLRLPAHISIVYYGRMSILCNNLISFMLLVVYALLVGIT